MADLAFLLQFRELADRVLDAHARIGCVELIQIDALDAQPLQARLPRLAQMRRAAASFPLIAPRADQPALRRDDEAVRVRMQRFGYETLIDVRSVGVGRIDEVDAQLQRSQQHAACGLAILRLAPDARAGQPHRTEAEAIHVQVAAESQGAGGRRSGCMVHRKISSRAWLSMWRRLRRLMIRERSGSHSMQYMLLIYEDERVYGPDRESPVARERRAQHIAYSRELGATRLAGSGLKDSSAATTIRTAAGKQTLHDGPFAESREQLGGYYLIDVPDLDAAIAIAKKVPLSQNGAVEIRPLLVAG